MIALSRTIAALAYAGAAFLFGVLLGERGELGAVQHAFTLVIPIATVIFLLITRQGRIEVLLTGLALFAGLTVGQRAFKRAFDECPSHASALRAAIAAERARTGDYPVRLGDPPCDCVLRRTILHYNANERGYRAWISDGRRTVVIATERSSGR